MLAFFNQQTDDTVSVEDEIAPSIFTGQLNSKIDNTSYLGVSLFLMIVYSASSWAVWGRVTTLGGKEAGDVWEDMCSETAIILQERF